MRLTLLGCIAVGVISRRPQQPSNMLNIRKTFSSKFSHCATTLISYRLQTLVIDYCIVDGRYWLKINVLCTSLDSGDQASSLLLCGCISVVTHLI